MFYLTITSKDFKSCSYSVPAALMIMNFTVKVVNVAVILAMLAINFNRLER